MPPDPRSSTRRLGTALAALMCMTGAQAGQPSRNPSTDLSAASMLPVAVSVALPVALVSGTATLVVEGVESSADGVGWVVQNSVTGAKASLRFTGKAVGVSAVALGTVVAVTAISTGWVLSQAGQAIAFVPNEIGKALLYDEKVSR